MNTAPLCYDGRQQEMTRSRAAVDSRTMFEECVERLQRRRKPWSEECVPALCERLSKYGSAE